MSWLTTETATLSAAVIAAILGAWNLHKAYQDRKVSILQAMADEGIRWIVELRSNSSQYLTSTLALRRLGPPQASKEQHDAEIERDRFFYLVKLMFDGTSADKVADLHASLSQTVYVDDDSLFKNKLDTFSDFVSMQLEHRASKVRLQRVGKAKLAVDIK